VPISDNMPDRGADYVDPDMVEAAHEALNVGIGASTQDETVAVNLAAAQVFATLAVAEASTASPTCSTVTARRG
jgi:hypothetical protein